MSTRLEHAKLHADDGIFLLMLALLKTDEEILLRANFKLLDAKILLDA